MAATANGTYSNQYQPEFELKVTEHTVETYDFEFPDGGVIMRRSDHLIVGFGFSPPDVVWPPPETWDSRNAIGDSAAVALGNEYIATTGAGPFVYKFLLRNENASGSAQYSLAYLPTAEGIAHHPDHRIYVGIEYNTGRLLTLARTAVLPNPPASFQVSIPLETALYIFATYVYTHYGVSHLNADFAELIIWNPKRKHVYPNEDNLPQSVRDLIGTNESTLAYMISALQPSMGQSYKPALALFEGYVDPVSGAVWSVIELSPFGGGGKPGLIRWDLGSGEITISNGKRSIEVKDADVHQAQPPNVFSPSAKLVLHRAKVVVVIEYDRTSGILRTSLGDNHSYGRPSDNLKRALDQLSR